MQEAQVGSVAFRNRGVPTVDLGVGDEEHRSSQDGIRRKSDAGMLKVLLCLLSVLQQ